MFLTNWISADHNEKAMCSSWFFEGKDFHFLSETIIFYIFVLKLNFDSIIIKTLKWKAILYPIILKKKRKSTRR